MRRMADEIVRLKHGDQSAWLALEGVCAAAFDGDPYARMILVDLIKTVSRGVPCCHSCAHGRACESDCEH